MGGAQGVDVGGCDERGKVAAEGEEFGGGGGVEAGGVRGEGVECGGEDVVEAVGD